MLAYGAPSGRSTFRRNPNFKMSGLVEGRKPDNVNLNAFNSLDDEKGKKYALTLMWLTDELEAEAEAAWPGEDDCSGNPPVYNAATLCVKITQLLPTGRTFYRRLGWTP
jgi:hypothetical protein